MLNGNEKLETMTKKFVEAVRVNTEATKKMTFQTDKIAQLQKLAFAKDDEIKALKLLLKTQRGDPQIDLGSSRSLAQIQRIEDKLEYLRVQARSVQQAHVRKSSVDGNNIDQRAITKKNLNLHDQKMDLNKMIQTQYDEMTKAFTASKGSHNLNSTISKAHVGIADIAEKVKSKSKLAQRIFNVLVIDRWRRFNLEMIKGSLEVPGPAVLPSIRDKPKQERAA